MTGVADAFAGALPEGHPAPDDGVRERVEQMVAAARRAWPEVTLPATVLAARLGKVVDAAGGLDAALDEIHIEDLYLCTAAMAGDAPAQRALERDYLLPELRKSLARHPSRESSDDLFQLLRERLLLGSADGAGKLDLYRGQGALRSWLRVVCMRTILNASRGRHREPPAEIELADLPAADDQPELALLKRHYRAEFKQAFGEALDALTPRQRNLLRQSTFHGLSIDELGALYGVHRTTAARWLRDIRADLLARTRRALSGRLRVGGTEVDSILRLIDSHFDVSLRGVLRDRTESGDS